MKMIGKLLIASVLAAGAAGCADYYGNDYGYGFNPAYDYSRTYSHDRDYGRDVVWDGGRRYCRTDDGSYVYCGRD